MLERYPLLEQLGNTSNQNNPLLQRRLDDTSIEFIWPTIEHGAYFRIASFTLEEFTTLKNSHLDLCFRMGDATEQTIFGKTPTPVRRRQVADFINRINEVFFKKPLIDLRAFEIMYSTVSFDQDIPKASIFMKGKDGFIYEIKSCNYYIEAAK